METKMKRDLFYLDSYVVQKDMRIRLPKAAAVNLGLESGKTVLEVSSDYDYRSSRYYADHRAEYDEHIPAAVNLVMKHAKDSERGIFAMDRVYRMTRDSYSGAIVSSGIKRRIDIEFLSFTRRADTRQTVTAVVKYAENRLRAVLGIKAKLGVDKINPEDTAVIDAYFEPMLPQSTKSTLKKLRRWNCRFILKTPSKKIIALTFIVIVFQTRCCFLLMRLVWWISSLFRPSQVKK